MSAVHECMIPGALISRVPLKGLPRSNKYGKYYESLLRLQYVNGHFDFQMENTAFSQAFYQGTLSGKQCMVPSSGSVQTDIVKKHIYSSIVLNNAFDF